MIESTVALDPTFVRALQNICLRLERLASGSTAQHGRAPDQSLALLALPIKDNADQDDLSRITENLISRVEVCIVPVVFKTVGRTCGRAAVVLEACTNI